LPGQTSSGGVDLYVRKYDATGNVVWTRQFGTPGTDYATGVSVDASGVYVHGSTTGTLPGQTSAGDSDVFVRKYAAPLSSEISLNPGLSTEPIAGKVLILTANPIGGTGTYSFSWDFGDGTLETGNPTAHTYSMPGVRTVTLTVTDGIGETTTVTKTFTVWKCPDVDGDTDVDIDDLIGVFLNQFTSNLQYDLDADGDVDIDDLIFVFLNQFQVTC